MIPLVSNARHTNFENSLYAIPVGFYLTPPKEIISLGELENLAFKRLELLKSIELLKQLEGEKFLTSMDALTSKYSLNIWSSSSDKEQQAVLRADVISHFVLRLAFSAPGNRYFFIKNECTLLNYRLRRLPSLAGTKWHDYDMARFMKNLPELQFERVTLDASTALLVNNGNRLSHNYTGQYFKVPFLRAIELVANRKVYLRDGFAYVTEDKMFDLIVHSYKNFLEQSANLASKVGVSRLERKVLNVMNKVLDLESQIVVSEAANTSFNNVKNESLIAVSISDLYEEKFSKRNLPPCMQFMLKELLTSHHLKYQGRIQLGLFLKGIGFSLNQSLEFWHREIVKKYGEEGWKKKGFTYNIEHNYGKQGRRKNYAPLSCNALIKSDRNCESDVCGCPFKYATNNILKSFFEEHGLSNDECEVVLHPRTSRQYQSACKEFFKFTHSIKDTELSQDFDIYHPNQYYNESIKRQNLQSL